MIAYKEWAPVVDALGDGRQILLLRKGGIAEGPRGFQPEHPFFWFYPTHFHPGPNKLRIPVPPTPVPDPGAAIPVRFHGRITDAVRVEDANLLPLLAPFHFWAEEEITKRWNYGSTPGLHVLVVRVSALPAPFPLPPDPAYGGCKSWVTLKSAPPSTTAQPVLDDHAFESLRQKILQILADPTA